MRICDQCESHEGVLECTIDLHVAIESQGRYVMAPLSYDLCLDCRRLFWNALGQANKGMKHVLFPAKSV